MFAAWGRAMYGRRTLVVVIALLAAGFAAAWGTGVFGRLQTAGGFTAPGSQSDRAASLAARAFGRDTPDVVVLYSSRAMTVHNPAYRAAVTAALRRLPHGRVVSAVSYFSTGQSRFVSRDGRDTYAILGLAGGSDTARVANYEAIKGLLAIPGLAVHAGGQIPFEDAATSQVKGDISRAEALSTPVLLALMIVIFGSVAAASLPLLIGGISILGSFTVLRLLAVATPVSTYAVNITTILGLGLAIDYGLFIVSRFRAELRRQQTVEQAVAGAMATAGRTVAVSGITVAAALAGLMLFPETFLRSMGYGGVATVAVDMLAALTVLPALLALLGHRVNALPVRRRAAQPRPAGAQGGGWYRLAASVMRRPASYMVAVVALLITLGLPFLHVSWGGTDARVLPSGTPARTVQQQLARDFPGNVTSPIEAVVAFPGPVPGSRARTAALASYARRLDALPGVQDAQITAVHGSIARIDVAYRPAPNSAAARAIVARIRTVPPPVGAQALAGGLTAQVADELSSLGQVLPWMGLVIVLATFVLLFAAFGSVVLPVKAIAVNVLSLSAMYGAIVWIFQDGHLAGLLGITPTGSIDPADPILIFAVMFGLSMDYEVFLLSRIREHYQATGDNTSSVAAGLQATGGIITSAALLLLIVVAAFSASGISFIKLLGTGMAIALIIDATVVRVLLVPATMRLLGAANWWAPRPLRRLHTRSGTRETSPAPALALAAALRTRQASAAEPTAGRATEE